MFRAEEHERSRSAAGGRKRAPFADRLPRLLKRSAGRKDAAQVPASIRLFGVNLDQNDQADIRKGLGVKLGKYAASIERVSVRVKDVNGPRGGVDQVCRIKVVLSGLPSVVSRSQAASIKAAISNSLTGVERAVRRSLQRRRMNPIKADVRRQRKRITTSQRALVSVSN